MARKQAKSALKKPVAAYSELERELGPVLTGSDRYAEVTRLLSMLAANEKHVMVTSYPASNAGME